MQSIWQRDRPRSSYDETQAAGNPLDTLPTMRQGLCATPELESTAVRDVQDGELQEAEARYIDADRSFEQLLK